MSENRWSPLRLAQEQALAAGQHTFSVPTPCQNGHIAPRWASNGKCTACGKERAARAKPVEERQITLRGKSSHVTQLTLDTETAALVDKTKRYMKAVVGRPVSTSLIHRAGIALLAEYLRGNPPEERVRRLVL